MSTVEDSVEKRLEEALKANEVLAARVSELESLISVPVEDGSLEQQLGMRKSIVDVAGVTVMDIDMDLFDFCMVESNWQHLVSSPSPEEPSIGGANGRRTPPISLQESIRIKKEKLRGIERLKERTRMVAHESWRYRPFEGLDVSPPADSNVERQQNRVDMGNISDIHDFCFPSGCTASYMSKTAAEVLVRGENDQFHLMQFANASGQQSYACVLTTTKIVESPDESVLDALANVASIKRPARIIRDFMRKLIVYIKKERWLNVELPNLHHEADGHMHHNGRSAGVAAVNTVTGSASSSAATTSSADKSPPTSKTPQSSAGRMYAYLSEATGSSSSTSTSNHNQGGAGGGEEELGGGAGGSTGESITSSFFGSSMPPRPPSQALDSDKDKEDAPRESMFSFGSSSGMGMSRNLFTSPSTFMKDANANAKDKDKDKEEEREKGDDKNKGIASGASSSPADATKAGSREGSSATSEKRGEDGKEKEKEKEESLFGGAIPDNSSFFTRMRNRWAEARAANAVKVAANPDSGKQRSVSMIQVNGATTTNPDFEVSLLPHTANQLTSDIDMLPDAPPDPAEGDLLDIAAYEQRRKDSESGAGSTSKARRKMSLSLRPKSGSIAQVAGTSAEKKSGAGSTRAVGGSIDADEPMLIPGISSTMGVADNTPGSGKSTPASPSPSPSHNPNPGGSKGSGSTLQERLERELEALDPATSTEKAQELLRLSEGAFNSPRGSQDGDSSDEEDSKAKETDTEEEQEKEKVKRRNEQEHRHRGKVVVAEVAYCVVSSYPIHTIGYHVLKSLADSERRVQRRALSGGAEQDTQDQAQAQALLVPGGEGDGDVGSEGGDASTPASLAAAASAARNAYLRTVHLSLTRWKLSGGLLAHMSKAGMFFTNIAYNKTIQASGLEGGDSPFSWGPRPFSATGAGALQESVANYLTQVSSRGEDYSALRLPGGQRESSGKAKKRRPSERRGSESGGGGGGDRASRRFSASSARDSEAGPSSPDANPAGNPDILRPLGLRMSRTAPVEEWALTVTLSYLNSGIILKLINLLLMEKSLVVVGRYSAIVSMVSIGVKNLILPFKWEGVFVPLVPNSARELFGAPVPYILGTTHPPRENEVSSTAAVLFLQEDEQSTFLSYTNDGDDAAAIETDTTDAAEPTAGAGVLAHLASLRDLPHYPVAETVAWFTRLPDTINADMPHDENVAKTIDSTRRYLKACRQRALGRVTAVSLSGDKDGVRRADTDLRPAKLDMHYLVNLTMRERSAVAGIARIIHSHNMQFCGDSVNPTAWRRYVRFNASTGEEEFYPNWFMQPVRRHVEFQEAVVQTQLFVGFMDSVREAAERQDRFRSFIYDWVTFRVHLAKNKDKLSLYKAYNIM